MHRIISVQNLKVYFPAKRDLVTLSQISVGSFTNIHFFPKHTFLLIFLQRGGILCPVNGKTIGPFNDFLFLSSEASIKLLCRSLSLPIEVDKFKFLLCVTPNVQQITTISNTPLMDTMVIQRFCLLFHS